MDVGAMGIHCVASTLKSVLPVSLVVYKLDLEVTFRLAAPHTQ